jgi:response regulator RpfG family c-di-GMP phosphodiesterase
MPSWLQWILLAGGCWVAAGTVFAFAFARLVARATAVADQAREPRTADIRGVDQQVAPGRTRVLIVDDDAPLRSLLRATLGADDYDVREAGSAEDAFDVLRFWEPGIVLLDVNLPGMDGLTFCAELRRNDDDSVVILLTGDQISDTTARMAGARAVVRKPFSPLELMGLLARVLEREEFTPSPPVAEDGQLLMYARDLASIAKTERRQRRLVQDAYRETAMALADAVDVRDRATALHAQRVRRYALGLAEAVDPSLLADPSLEYGFLLHDVGKIAISDRILRKPGPLSEEERDLLREHPTIGAQILRNVAMLHGSGLDVVRSHHERWDGAGYPDGLAGEQIPLAARVFAVVDTLDAMTSDRPYRLALIWDDAVEEILAQRGRQFDPSIVELFAAGERDLRAVYEDLRLVA